MTNKLTIERNVVVAMRDGVRLATDLYRPDDDARHPVLVHRTPYDKSNGQYVTGLMLNPIVAAERGYVVVVQDTRGRFASEGRWAPIVDDAADGYDTVEWAAAQPWSNGSVGVYGSSYMGITTLQAAVAAPPHLKAAFAYLTGANYHNGLVYSGGAFELGFSLFWTTFMGWNAIQRLDLDRPARRALTGKLVEAAADPWQAARHRPLRDLPAFSNAVVPHWQEWLRHPAYDEYWQAIDVVARAEEIKVPLLHITGWYDGFLRGHLDLNARLQRHPDERVRNYHRLIVGPWDHEAYMNGRPTAAGERDFGPGVGGGPGLTTNLLFQWFDHWLLGLETPLLNAPRVRYYMLGRNAWQEAESWPPPQVPARYYLHSAGRANSRFGDGTLTPETPTAEPPDSYSYDPANPVPSVGGRTLHPVFGPGGIQNQARVEEREDVLVYTSPRLIAPLAIAGPVSVTLFAASSAPDTDFTAKLIDVELDGYCANVAEGIIRARYRDSLAREELLTPGEVVAYTVDLWDVAHTFRPGHRVRLEVSSSNFPRFDCNANAAVSPGLAGPADVRVAVQQVFHDAPHPSHVTLPVMAQ